MHKLTSPSGITVSCDKGGSGPPLVLVHGSFSDHRSNWEFVKPTFAEQFTVYAVARRGRGETEATEGHSVEDEAGDAAAVLKSIAEPVCLLGHSYGAMVALAAASSVPEHIRKLILYEPPWPHLTTRAMVERLKGMAAAGRWEELAVTFFHEVISVPMEEVEELRHTELWPSVVADAEATLGDLSALSRYRFVPEAFRELPFPVLLQPGLPS